VDLPDPRVGAERFDSELSTCFMHVLGVPQIRNCILAG